jgi:hypothetical protein
MLMSEQRVLPDAIQGRAETFCIACHYPLRQLAPTTRNCPECGRPFDPTDPSSVNVGHPIPRTLRWSLGPVRWLYPAVRVVVILALLADVPLGGVIRYAWVTLGLLWLPVGLVYYLRQALRRWVVWRYQQDYELLDADEAQVRRSRRIMGIAVLLLLFRIPFYIVFLPSLPWLNRCAHEEYSVKPFDAPRPTHVVVGLIPVRAVYVHYGGVTFDTWIGQLTYHEDFEGTHWWTSLQFQDDLLERVPW